MAGEGIWLAIFTFTPLLLAYITVKKHGNIILMSSIAIIALIIYIKPFTQSVLSLFHGNISSIIVLITAYLLSDFIIISAVSEWNNQKMMYSGIIIGIFLISTVAIPLNLFGTATEIHNFKVVIDCADYGKRITIEPSRTIETWYFVYHGQTTIQGSQTEYTPITYYSVGKYNKIIIGNNTSYFLVGTHGTFKKHWYKDHYYTCTYTISK